MSSTEPTKRYFIAIALALIAWSLALVAPTAHAQSVTSVACSPSIIGGGSGGSATCTVTLGAAAPAGGTVVTLTSSLTELAASMPRVTVPAGQTAANFTVTTNARYRRYSLLAFRATISASANGTTRSATLNVTAQPRPADFNSGSQAGANTQWQGLMCGGIAPIGGNREILYDCAPASGTGFGSCTFRQECSIGCRRVPPSGGTFNDFCATTGPNAVAVSRNYFVSGDHVPATVITEAPVTIPTTAVPSAVSIGSNARSFSPADVGGLHFPVGVGATSIGFDVATSYVPSIEFVDVGGFWYDADIPPFLITNGRGGHTWVAMVPPVSAPAQPIPTPVQFKIVGANPVTGGQSSLAQVHLSGIPYGIGPTITLTSSHPAIASVPSSITPPASNILGFDVPIATQPPAADTNVTITATDGRYTFSATLTVLVPPPPALLAGVSVNPTSVVGGASATGTVTLSAAQTGPTAVQVSIIDTAPATLPSNNPPCPPSSRCYNVTVPAGATSANFTIATSARTEADGQFNLNIFANLAGSPERQALLLITPGGALAVKTLTINPVDAVGGISRTGTVTLTGAAPAGGVVVALSRDNTAATVPTSVTVAAGQTSASFTVTTSSVTATTVVRVSATFNGVTLNADMTLFTLLSQVSFPGNVPGGNATVGTVTLGAAAPSGGSVVALSSANPGLVAVPASVTVPAGQTSASFAVNTASVTTTTPVVISASLNGTTVSTTLFLVVSRAVSAVTLNPSSVADGSPSTGTVTLRAAAPTGNAVVSLASSNTLLAAVPTTVTVSAGQTSATFTVNTAPVSATATVVISASYEGVTQSATLTLNATASTGATLSTVSLNPSSVVGGTSSTGTVTLSAAAPSGGATVSLSDNSAAATAPASVTVPAGASSAPFTVTTTAVTASTSVTISAVLAGVTRTAALTLAPPGANVTLAVTATGRSGERVISSPAGINVAVGGTQSASFATNSSITLSVSNGRDAIWSGACSSGGNKTKTCTFTISGNASVTGNVQ